MPFPPLDHAASGPGSVSGPDSLYGVSAPPEAGLGLDLALLGYFSLATLGFWVFPNGLNLGTGLLTADQFQKPSDSLTVTLPARGVIEVEPTIQDSWLTAEGDRSPVLV
ncbi:MAG: hypothetical protein ACYDIC_18800 [Desulfobaccales bacterium]